MNTHSSFGGLKHNKPLKALASLAGTQTSRLCHFVPIIAAMFVPLSGVLYSLVNFSRLNFKGLNMKLYPFSQVTSKNLKLLLLAARLLASSAILLFVAIVVFAIYFSFVTPQTIMETVLKQGVISNSFFAFITAAILLVISGLSAAVVSCEYKYTNE